MLRCSTESKTFLLLACTIALASAGIFGNNLGVGLADCTVKSPQLLGAWQYNATESTLRATDATPVCKTPTSCDDTWCLAIDNTPSDLPITEGTGAGVYLRACPRFDPKNTNKSSEDAAWTFDTSSGKLGSMYMGQAGQTASMVGFCLQQSESGVLELVACKEAGSWKIDATTGRLEVVNNHGSSAASAAQCLFALNTTSPCSFNPKSLCYSTANCDEAPGNLLPFCNTKRPLEERISNLLSFSYMNELPAGFARLGLPHSPPTGECLHGFVTDCLDNETCTTTFPDALASASSFNDTLFEAIGKAIATEGRAVDNINQTGSRMHTICWSPDINPFRHPLWGRGQEVPSEDPLLCGRYGAGYVRGLQGRDDPEGNGFLRLVASPKHFLGYDLEGFIGSHNNFMPGPDGVAWNRHNFTNHMSAQELVEYYALPFKHAVIDGGALGMMCSYNAVDVASGGKSTGSIPACAFTELQDGMARGQWNFSGYIVSDCGAIADFLEHNKCSGCPSDLPTHGLCKDANFSSKCPECSSKCANTRMYGGGTDAACGAAGDQLGSLRSGMLKKSQVVASARRILRVMMSLGLSNPKAEQPYQHLGRADVGSAATMQLSLEASRQSMVLLKNEPVEAAGASTTAVAAEPVLPLKPGQTVVALGYPANNSGNYLSNYHPGAPDPRFSKKPLPTAVTALAAAGFNVTYSNAGCAINLHGNPPDMVGLNKSVKLAQEHDVAILFVGLDAGEEHESGDRNYTGAGLGLPGDQAQMIERVSAANPRTVVVLIHGSPVAIPYAKEHVPAIIDAHYPGDMGGQGIVDVLTGKFNPCGRLTTTIYPKEFVKRSIFDTGLRSDGGLTYMHYDGKYGAPLWEFGDGISYSRMSAKAHGSAPTTVQTNALASAPVSFSVEVTNEGGPDGCFSALGFISSKHPEAPKNKKLFDYTRLNLRAGESAVATVQLTAATAALVEEDGSSRLLPGSYTIAVAGVNFTVQLAGAPVLVAPAPPLTFSY